VAVGDIRRRRGRPPRAAAPAAHVPRKQVGGGQQGRRSAGPGQEDLPGTAPSSRIPGRPTPRPRTPPGDPAPGWAGNDGQRPRRAATKPEDVGNRSSPSRISRWDRNNPGRRAWLVVLQPQAGGRDAASRGTTSPHHLGQPDGAGGQPFFFCGSCGRPGGAGSIASGCCFFLIAGRRRRLSPADRVDPELREGRRSRTSRITKARFRRADWGEPGTGRPGGARAESCGGQGRGRGTRWCPATAGRPAHDGPVSGGAMSWLDGGADAVVGLCSRRVPGCGLNNRPGMRSSQRSPGAGQAAAFGPTAPRDGPGAGRGDRTRFSNSFA